MKNIFKISLLSSLILSFNSRADVKELTLISLESGETLIPSNDIKSVSKDSILLFDGRIINQAEIENIEVMNPNGSSKIIEKGLFKFLKIDGARVSVGGDATGGG